jgi:hypothetical protein
MDRRRRAHTHAIDLLAYRETLVPLLWPFDLDGVVGVHLAQEDHCLSGRVDRFECWKSVNGNGIKLEKTSVYSDFLPNLKEFVISSFNNCSIVALHLFEGLSNQLG